MKIVFDGSVLVSSCVGEELSYLLLEPGKGCGIVGEFTNNPDRVGGKKVDINDVGEAATVLEFSTPKSIAVVMEKLQQLLMHQLGMPV